MGSRRAARIARPRPAAATTSSAIETIEQNYPFAPNGVFTFLSNPPPAQGNEDQFFNGGGPAFLPNDFRGTDDAAAGAAGIGTPDNEHRLGHLTALQRSSRAADGTPMHIRMDGPGFDRMDVPDGSNFLIPPRRHRAFPLVEVVSRH